MTDPKPTRWPDRFCRWCQAQPGEPCRRADGREAKQPHSERVRVNRLYKVDPVTAELVRQLIDRRRRLGIDQTELSKRSGLRQQQISHMELGVRPVHLDDAMAYAKAVGLKLELTEQ